MQRPNAVLLPSANFRNFSPPPFFMNRSGNVDGAFIVENAPNGGNFAMFPKAAQCPNSISDAPITTSSNVSKLSSLKRASSVPMGINFIYPSTVETMSPSSLSSSCSESSTLEDVAAKMNAAATAAESTRKAPSSSFYLFERRPSSASASVTRHRYSTDTAFGTTPPMPIRLRDRGVEKLKREANIRTCIESDYAVEKLSVTGAAIMGSLDEFNIDDDPSSPVIEQRKRTQSLTEPVHVMTNFLPSPCSPSPTRIEKQCYSPSMQQVVRGMALSPATSPRPGRHHCVRSLSPIAVRGAFKRKHDSDTEGGFAHIPAKRLYASLPPTPPFSLSDRFPKIQGTLQLSDQSFAAASMDSESSNSTISSDVVNVSSQQSKSPFYQQPSQPALNMSRISSPTGDAGSVGSMDLPDNLDSLMDES